VSLGKASVHGVTFLRGDMLWKWWKAAPVSLGGCESQNKVSDVTWWSHTCFAGKGGNCAASAACIQQSWTTGSTHWWECTTDAAALGAFMACLPPLGAYGPSKICHSSQHCPPPLRAYNACT